MSDKKHSASDAANNSWMDTISRIHSPLMQSLNQVNRILYPIHSSTAAVNAAFLPTYLETQNLIIQNLSSERLSVADILHSEQWQTIRSLQKQLPSNLQYVHEILNPALYQIHSESLRASMRTFSQVMERTLPSDFMLPMSADLIRFAELANDIFKVVSEEADISLEQDSDETAVLKSIKTAKPKLTGAKVLEIVTYISFLFGIVQFVVTNQSATRMENMVLQMFEIVIQLVEDHATIIENQEAELKNQQTIIENQEASLKNDEIIIENEREQTTLLRQIEENTQSND